MSETITSARAGEFATARRGGIDYSEIQFITAKAAAGASPSSIAKMLGRPLHDVLDHCPKPAPKPEWITPGYPVLPLGPPAPAKPDRRVPSHASKRQKPQAMSSRARDIVRGVAALYGLELADMTGPSQRAFPSRARDQASWRLFQAGYSYSQIGRYLGGRDHTSIMSAVRRHDTRLLAESGERREPR